MALSLLLVVMLYLLVRDAMTVAFRARWRRDPLRLTAPLGDLNVALSVGFAILAVTQANDRYYWAAPISAYLAVARTRIWWRTGGDDRCKAITARVRNHGHRPTVEEVHH